MVKKRDQFQPKKEGGIDRSSIDRRMIKRYGKEAEWTIADFWLGLLGSLKDQKILDVGRGSTEDTQSDTHTETSSSKDRSYEPWLCRQLLEAGARPIGFDIGTLDNELFEHHKGSFLDEDAFSFIDDDSLDGINVGWVLDERFPSPALEDSSTEKDRVQAKKNLLREAERTLKEGRWILFIETDPHLYKKENGKLAKKDIALVKRELGIRDA